MVGARKLSIEMLAFGHREPRDKEMGGGGGEGGDGALDIAPSIAPFTTLLEGLAIAATPVTAW